MPSIKTLVIIGVVILGCLLAAQSAAAKRSLSRQETWVLQRVVSGQWADLKEQFGEKEENRRLSAAFLKDLFTGDYKVQPKGVLIANAIISMPLDLEGAQIPHMIFLRACQFNDAVIFRAAVFEKDLILNNSKFCEEANFFGVRVKKSLYCRDSIFQSPVYFGVAEIGGSFEAGGAKFLDEEHTAHFNSLKVEKHAVFKNATFKGNVEFSWADINGLFGATEAKFFNKAIFKDMRVGQNAFFDKAVFHGPVNFVRADIGQFEAGGAEFLNKDHTAHFNSLKVRNHAYFSDATFQGPVEFSWANISGTFESDRAQFLSQEKLASFNDLKVGRTAFFRNAVFEGPVNFARADISESFVAEWARFLSKEHINSFASLKVGKNAHLNNATFQGTVDFNRSNMSESFFANSAKFLKEVNLKGIQVSQTASFRNVIFKSNVDMSYGSYQDLILEGAMFEGTKLEETEKEKQEGAGGLGGLNLIEAVIQRTLHIKNYTVAALYASHLHVKGPATFEGLIIKEIADFQNATIEDLRFKDIEWPGKKENLKLEGLTYSSLYVDEPNNFPGLLGLMEKSTFNLQNYLGLEKYCIRAGHKDWADKVYIAMKDRELAHMSWYNPGRWVIWLFWGWLAGYGRYPFRTFGLGLLIVIIGTLFMFDPKYLKVEFLRTWKLNYELTPLKIFKKDYSFKNPKKIKMLGKLLILRFIISFDQFIPAIDLGLAKNWQPPELSFWAWFYVYFQKISGWILVPIGLAAIASQFK